MRDRPHYLVRAALLFICYFGFTPQALAEIKFVPMGDASLAINSANYDGEFANTRQDSQGNPVSSDSQSTAEAAYFYFAPNLGFEESPGLWITPTLEFEYNGANNILNLEDEAFLYSRRLDFYYLLGINYRFDRHWQAKLKGFGRIEKVQDAASENMDTGLYNYNDLGAWGEINAKYQLGLPMRSKLGFKGYARRYPNYTNAEFVTEYERTVGPWPADVPRNMHEKDVDVVEFWLRQESTWGRIPLLTNLDFRIKDVKYTEMLQIQSDGTFGDSLRDDVYLDASLELPWLINEFYQLEFDYGYRIRASTQNEYNVQEYLFIPGYFNYYQNNVRLLFNFKFAFTISGYAPRGSIGVTWQERRYFNRPSRQQQYDGDTVGAYVFTDAHWESKVDFGITLRQQLFAKWFNLFLSIHSITQNSNSNVEDAATYIYKFSTFTLGTAVSF